MFFSAKTQFLSDVAYSEWANRRLLEACSGLDSGLLEQDLGASHSHILSTLRHVCDGEKVWLDCLSTTPEGGSWRLPTGPAPEPSLDELRNIWPQLWSGYQRWVEALSDNGLQVEMIVHLPDGSSPRIARWKILRHVLDHSTFHRGQIVGMIRTLRETPPAINRMDYFLADGQNRAQRF